MSRLPLGQGSQRIARGTSNPKKQLPSQILEEENKKLEEKLLILKEMVHKDATKREIEGTRWRAADRSQPLKKYSALLGDQKSLNKEAGNTLNSSNPSKGSSIASSMKNNNKTKILAETSNLEVKRPSEKKTSFTDLNSSSASLTNSNKPPSRPSSKGSSSISFRPNPSKGTSLTSTMERPASKELLAPLKSHEKKTLKKGEEALATKNEEIVAAERTGSSSLAGKNFKKGEVMEGEDQNSSMRDSRASASNQSLRTSELHLGSNKQDIRKGSAEQNLKKALFNQKKDSFKEVSEFLSKLNLIQHLDCFLLNGFDEEAVLVSIEPFHLNQMKIPVAHQKTILQGIQKRLEEGSKKSGKESQSNEGAEKLKLSEGVGTDTRKDANNNAISKVSSKTKPIKLNDELGAGEFNEEASHAYFLEALEEFRKAKPNPNQTENKEGTRPDNTVKKKKSVRFAQPTEEENEDHGILPAIDELEYVSSKSHKKKFNWANMALSDNNEIFGTWENKFEVGSLFWQDSLPNHSEVSIGKDIKEGKLTCWQCMRSFLEAAATYCDYSNKAFCTEGCKQKFRTESMEACKVCGVKIFRKDGILKNQVYLCGQICLKIYLESENSKLSTVEQNTFAKLTPNSFELERLKQISMKPNSKGNSQNNSFEGVIDMDFNLPDSLSNNILTIEELEQKYN